MATTAQQFIGNDDLTLCYMQLLLVVGQLCEASGRKTKTFAVIKKKCIANYLFTDWLLRLNPPADVRLCPVVILISYPADV